MRTIESMNHASSSGEDKSSTQNNNTETQPNSSQCLIEGCGKIHRAAKSKKTTQSLAFCDVFKKMNIKQRAALAKKLSACNRCLQPGHGVKTCKLENLKCRTCEGNGHATLLCRKGGDNKSDSKDKGSKAKPADTATHQTVTEKEDDPVTVEAPPALPETTSNLGVTTPSSYDLLESEAYLLSRDGNTNPVHTCVGQVCAIDSQGRESIV